MRLRVVLVNQYYAPDEAATAQLLADVGAGLARAGHDVRAVCSNRCYRDPAHRYPPSETIDGVRILRSPTGGLVRGGRAGRLLDYASFLLGLAVTLARGDRPDVVVCLSTPPMLASVGLLLARLRGARFVFWVMDVYPELAFELGAIRRGSLAGRLLGRISRTTLRHADRVVALGETMARGLAGVPADRVEVIHNWADGELIRPRSVERHPLREEWGWTDRFVVLYSGHMGLSHEFDTVLAAAARLRDQASIRFAFVGAGPRRDETAERVRREGLPNVEFRDYVPRSRLGEGMTAGDLHLLTLRDGLGGLLVPSKIYGILAAGRPTLYVGPEGTEVAEILDRGGCGTRVANGDAEALAEAVLRYRREAGLREEQGRRARELFDRRFTRRRGVGEFVDLLEGSVPETDA